MLLMKWWLMLVVIGRDGGIDKVSGRGDVGFLGSKVGGDKAGGIVSGWDN